MIVGKVIGSIVSTRKQENLVGNKLTLVEPITGTEVHNNQILAVDTIGAGIGEYVIVTFGSAARIGCGNPKIPVDAAIIGIVDDIGKIG